MNTTKDHNPARYISKYLALRIVVRPTFTKEVDGRIVTVPGKDIRFVDGAFETSDEELITFLEADRSFGTTYIRIPDNVENIVKERDEMLKDLETREKEILAREASLKAREDRVNSNEEGAKAGDGLRKNMPKAELLAIVKEEGVEGVDADAKNEAIIVALRAHRESKREPVSNGDDGDKAKF